MDDAKDLHMHADDAVIASTLRDIFPHPYTLDDAISFISYVHASEQEKVWSIRYNDEVIGVIGGQHFQDVYHPTFNLGYWIGRKYWGRGFCTQALGLALDQLWLYPEIKRIEACVFENNPASARVLEKCGFTHEVTRPNRVMKNGVLLSEHCYALLRS